MFLCKLLLHSLSADAILQAIQSLIALIHIVHIMIAGIMEDVELRILAQHRLQTILHGEDAANHHRASGLDIRLANEDIRESFHHSLGDALVLEGAKWSQFAITSLGILTYQLHLLQGFLALSRQLALLLRFQ